MEISIYNLVLTGHVLGVALGAGGAFASDLLFLNSIKDRHISRTESRLMGALSKLVWLGIGVLVTTGIGLVWLDPSFLQSSKFLAKITVVIVIILNGLIFHVHHLPLLNRSHIKAFSADHELVQKRIWILANGAISMTSWFYAILLGMIKNLSLSYSAFIGIYVFLVSTGIVLSLILKEKIIPSK